MKFGKYLERHQVSEWRKKYVYYKMFKKQIKAIKRAMMEDEAEKTNLLAGPIKRKLRSDSSIFGAPTFSVPLQPIEATGSITTSNEDINSNNNSNSNINSSSNHVPPAAGGMVSFGSVSSIQLAPRNQEREQKKFDLMLNDEFDKVNLFYQQREEEFIKQFNHIRDILTSLPPKKEKKKTQDDGESHLSVSSPFNFLHHRLSRKVSKRNLSSSAPDARLSRKSDNIKPTIDYSFDTSLPSNTAATRSIEEVVTSSQSSSPSSTSPLASQPSLASAPGPKTLLEHATKAESYTPKLKPGKIKRSLKRALQENYREIEILKEYVHLNHTAFRKIFKKYDKVLGCKNSEEAMARAADQYFYKSKKITAIEHEIEVLYTDYYTPGNRREAMTKLRINQDYRAPSHVIFQTGLLTGGSIILFIFCVRYMVGNVSIFYFDDPYPIDFLSMFILFRCLLLPIIMIWYFGFLMYVCNGKKINDILILGWDPRTTTNYQHILLLASVLTFMWNVALYLYVYLSTHIDGKIPLIFPFLLFMSILIFLFCPFDFFHRSSRAWLIKTFMRIFSAPMLTVKFKDFFFGDQFTSLALVLSDLEYTICFFVYDIWTSEGRCWALNPYFRPILVSIPPLLRALQSIRRYRDSKQRIHMMNFGKYSATITTSIMSAISHSKFATGNVRTVLITFWIISLSISSVYSCTWDYLMDWDVLHTSSKNFLLRDHLVYRNKYFYYWAIVSNALLRVSWSITVSFESYSSKEKELILLCTSILEVTRRFQWNFFRLENEHLNNVGKFRAFDLKIPDVYSVPESPRSSQQSEPLSHSAQTHSQTQVPQTQMRLSQSQPSLHTLDHSNNNNNNNNDKDKINLINRRVSNLSYDSHINTENNTNNNINTNMETNNTFMDTNK